MADDMGTSFLRQHFSEAQTEQITPPASVAKGDRPDGDGPKPPKK